MARFLRILHVDDDEDILAIVRLSLDARDRVEVRAAQTSEEAFDLLAAQMWVPDLILLDIRLGGETSLEMLRRLRILHPELPVILLSAASEEEAKGYRPLGVKGFIRKPFDPLSLFDRIRTLLA